MKNISRRVFIKGLAVAGVAAAASTVLAGCNTNMIPGVDDGNEDEGTETPANQKITLTDPDTGKSMTIEMTKDFQYISDTNMGIISVHADNRLGDIVYFNNVKNTADVYYLTVTCKTTMENGNVEKTITALDSTTDNGNMENAFDDGNALNSTGLADKNYEDTQILLTMPSDADAKKNWKTVEVSVNLCKYLNSATQIVSTGKFTFNK